MKFLKLFISFEITLLLFLTGINIASSRIYKDICNVQRIGVVKAGDKTLGMRLQANENKLLINGKDYSFFGELKDGTSVGVLFERDGYYFVGAKLHDEQGTFGFVNKNNVILESGKGGR